MRATLSGYYRNLQFDQSKTARELFDVTKQISSGQKIQYAHEDTSLFVDAVRLDNEVTTLTQIKQNAQKALQVSTNTDTTMNEMTKILEAMKVKMVAATNDTNSPESLNALAAELRGLERNLIDLANTSIDGSYLFSGSDVNTKPIDANGVYQGNEKDLQAFIGSGVQQTYNINGADLFLGNENDTQRKISLNIPLLNQTLLYPDVMIEPSIPRSTAKEEYISVNSTIRDLMGDRDENINYADAQHHFYIRGTDHDGVSFKEVISMRDDESVNDLLIRIGEAYGNVGSQELVKVTLNNHGQIEIEDQRPGSSKLDFHMVANTDLAGPVADTVDLNFNTTDVKAFVKSDYTEFVSSIGQRRDMYDPFILTLSGDFLTQDGQKAVPSTLISDVFRSDVLSIDLSGTDSATPGVALPATSFDILPATSTMQDLMDAIETAYDSSGTDMFVSMTDGKIVIRTEDGTSADLNIVLESFNAAGGAAGGGVSVEGIPSDAAVAYDESEFKKDGNKLLSNVAQVDKITNEYATLDTRLIDVAGVTTLNGESLLFEGINVAGNAFSATIDFSDGGSTFTVTQPAGSAGTYNIYNTGLIPASAIGISNPQTPVVANEMTYKQLTDVMNMIVTDIMPANGVVAGVATQYNQAVEDAGDVANVTLSFDGRIEFSQLNTTNTRASFSLSDVNASDFSDQDGVTPGIQYASSVFSFQSNNALEISDPKTNFFKQIDAAISSVEAARSRADGTLGNPRDSGMQNAMQALDDLAEHLFNQHSRAGVHSQTLQITQERTDMMIITTKSLRSETLDVDIAEASLQLKQLEVNYQAMLSTVSRITQLSLVNYL